jgi:N-acetylglucosaminyldiphosphoundecaprenol N-acetyl-beta-D-mannosaminyltransferase
VLGVQVDALDLERATEKISLWIDKGQKRYVCATGVHGIMESQRSAEVMTAHRHADLVVPDGMPLVWCGRRLGVQIDRVYGPDLMLSLLEKGLEPGWRHALYGSSEEVLHELQNHLTRRFPKLGIVGAISPPYGEMSDAQARQDVAALNAMRPDIIWIGLSTPKQEMWMCRWRPGLTANVLIGVGAAFDFHSGRVKQAPRFLQRHGLEWAYRLGREPRRLWRRYFRNNPAFVLAILRQWPSVLDHMSSESPRTHG